MNSASLADLRRIAEGLVQMKGRQISEATLRHDARQIKLGLDDGAMVLVSVAEDEHGVPRLEIDVVRTPGEAARTQLEVQFD